MPEERVYRCETCPATSPERFRSIRKTVLPSTRGGFSGRCPQCQEMLARGAVWEELPTPHGPRFHREVANLQLDVEEAGAGGSWVASALRCNVLVNVIHANATAAAAALAIETWANIKPRPLPEAARHD